jgi:hypothetical protein
MLARVRRRIALTCSLAAATIAFGVLPGAARADSATLINPTEIRIPGTYTGPATVGGYPSRIGVAGLAGTVSRVRVLLININWGGDREQLDLALVGPGGQKVMLWSDACGIFATVDGQDFLLDDAAATALSDAGPCAPGTYRPSNFVGNAPEPDNLSTGGGPTAPFSSQLAAFNGGSPNGSWDLYMYSDSSGDFISIGAWALFLDTQVAPQPTPVTQTGQRAAALAKCKKKQRRKARRKCRRKANQLPL